MRKYRSAILLTLAMMLSLAGCGADTGAQSAEESASSSGSASASASSGQTVQFGLEDVRAAADLTKVLANHECVVTTTQSKDENDEIVAETTTQYSMGAAGLCTDSTVVVDGETSYLWNFIGQDLPGAAYYGSPDNPDEQYMDLYLSSEYETFASGIWADYGGEDEEFQSCSMQDGAVIVTTRQDFREVAECYNLNYYYLDPDSGELLAVFVESFSTADDSSLGTSQTAITYDEPYEPEYDPTNSILDGEDGVQLTVVMTADGQTETQEFTIAPGTTVDLCSGRNFTLYSDEALTETLNLIGTIESDTTVYAVYTD